MPLSIYQKKKNTLLKTLAQWLGMGYIYGKKSGSTQDTVSSLQTYKVVDYQSGGDEKSRCLMALGLVPGCIINMLYNPKNANMVVIGLGSGQLAIRKSLWKNLVLEDMNKPKEGS